MLDNLGNVCLVSATDFTGSTLGKISEPTVHPVLPEDTDTVTEGREVRLDHAEGTVNGPEDEEYNEQVMSVPESFELSPSRLLGCSDNHGG